MKKLLKTLIVAAFIFSLSATVVLAQSDEIQEANTEVQESTNELIEAKDQESPFTLSQRIKAFKDVIDLSLTEAKDIKVKLLSLDISDEKIEKWREGVIEGINESISHYEEVNEFINDNEESLTEQEIIEEAKKFKQWRQENYVPAYEDARNFILMNKEEEIINTAKNRWEKIQKDIKTLRNAGIGQTEKLDEMLQQSKQLIDKGENQNKKAFDLFLNSIVENSTSTEQATSTATSTNESASTTTEISSTSTDSLDQMNTNNTTTMTSTTSNQTTTTEVQAMSLEASTQSTTTEETSTTTPDSLNVSIRGLVGSSLQNVRESYQVFIEMSNFVRELLR